MALTRKFLSALGIDDVKIDEIIQAHTDTVNGLKDEIEKYKADAEKLPAVTKERDDLKKASEETDGKNPYKVKYDALKEDFAKFKQDIEAKESKAKKDSAYKALLKEAGVSEKRIDAILRVSDVDALELEADGQVKNHDDMVKSIKSEWSDFIVSEGKGGANTATPPAGNGKTFKSKDEIFAIKDTAERQKAISENHEMFGF
jgi:hypothetical protein